MISSNSSFFHHPSRSHLESSDASTGIQYPPQSGSVSGRKVSKGVPRSRLLPKSLFPHEADGKSRQLLPFRLSKGFDTRAVDINNRICRLPMSEESCWDIYELYNEAKRIGSLNKVVFATTWNRLGKVINYNPRIHFVLSAQFVEEALRVLHTLPNREFDYFLHGFAHLVFLRGADNLSEAPELMKELIALVLHQVALRAQDLDHSQLPRAAWAIAKIGIIDEELKRILIERGRSLIPFMESQGFSEMAWSLATLHIIDPAFMKELADRAVVIKETLTAVNISNIAWAYATVDIPNHPLMEALAEQSQMILTELSPQSISMIIWAFSTLGIQHKALVNAILDNCEHKIMLMKPFELSNFISALFKQGVKPEASLMMKICHSIRRRVAELPLKMLVISHGL